MGIRNIAFHNGFYIPCLHHLRNTIDYPDFLHRHKLAYLTRVLRNPFPIFFAHHLLRRAGQIKLDNAPLLTCQMAMRLAKFSEDQLQIAAKDLLGTTVKRLKHIGTYNCRSIRQFKGVLSQHAFANAIDVSGFELSNGTVINVARDWKVAGAKAKFLKRVSSEACDAFRVAVSPEGDANHFNHLHWDMGPYRSCR